MKTVCLLRHAKSDWSDAALDDFDRPLNTRGRAAAPRMAAHLRDTGIRPDLVLCSSALRARETCAAVAAAFGGDLPVEERRDLYLAEPDRLLDTLRSVGDAHASVLIVGHNPGLHEFALQLVGDPAESAAEPRLLRRLEQGLPTGAFVEIACAVARWTDIVPGCGRLVAFVRPKDL